MGVSIKDILDYDIIKIGKLNNKRISIDSFNLIYQFLASIRQPNGEPLSDKSGNLTSHLKGLFNRCVYFKKNNIKPIFVFDGIAPPLKKKVREQRRAVYDKSLKNYEDAKERGDDLEMSKFSKALNKLDSKMIEDSKQLIKLFGFPIITAPSEGEAQSAYLTNNNLIFASSSQDFDSLLFGAKKLIRNFSIGGKKKIANTSMFKDLDIEFYDLEKNLERLKITIDDLIIIGMLCGTDFNPKGIPRIGSIKALKLVQKLREENESYDLLFKRLNWSEFFDYPFEDVFDIFKKMEVKKEDEVSMEFSEIKKNEIKEFLKQRDFDENAILRSLDKIKNINTLNKFF